MHKFGLLCALLMTSSAAVAQLSELEVSRLPSAVVPFGERCPRPDPAACGRWAPESLARVISPGH